MPTEKKRVLFIPDTESLAVLGYGLDSDGPTACATGPARRLARLVEQATRELSAVLTRAEWNAIADANSGCLELRDPETELPVLAAIAWNVQDAEGLGPKWGVDAADLSRRLAVLTPLHGEAIAAAVRWFWAHCDEIDHGRDEWWRPAFRRGAN